MSKLRFWLYVAAVVVLVGLVGSLAYYAYDCAKYKELYIKELTNVKAYQSENNDLKNSSIAHLLTIDQLIASRDSADTALKEALKKLNIKPKNVTSAGSVTSSMEKRDSIILRDTVFIRNLKLDTIIGDKWYKAELSLRYPSRIDLAISTKSIKHIIVHNRKETVNPPKKWWLLRLFQKKHTIQEVVVDEENPYIEAGSQRFINIIK